MKRFIIRARDHRVQENCVTYVESLDSDQDWKVEITHYDPKRSVNQNDFLHAVPLKIIADHTGFSLDETKDYLLGEAFGWEDVEIMGRAFSRPLRRSSSLTTKEFTWFLEWIEAWASDKLSLIIPRPNEYITEGEMK